MLTVAKSPIHTLGVFTDSPIPKDSVILRCSGQLRRSDELIDGVDDNAIQIGKDLYSGPTGGLEDYINHSCKPNSGLVVANGGASFRAIRDIEPGEEIVWDYSTTQVDKDWSMKCNCGASSCRKRIAYFRSLPSEIKKLYVMRGVVPDYAQTVDEGRKFKLVKGDPMIKRSPLKLISGTITMAVRAAPSNKTTGRNRS